jgi:hypothetical protein
MAIGGADNPYHENSPFGLITGIHWAKQPIIGGTGFANWAGFLAGVPGSAGFDTPISDDITVSGIRLENGRATGDVQAGDSLAIDMGAGGEFDATATALILAGPIQADGIPHGPGGFAQIAILQVISFGIIEGDATYAVLAVSDVVTIDPNSSVTVVVRVPRQALPPPGPGLSLTVGITGSPTVVVPVDLTALVVSPSSTFSVNHYAPP